MSGRETKSRVKLASPACLAEVIFRKYRSFLTPLFYRHLKKTQIRFPEAQCLTQCEWPKVAYGTRKSWMSVEKCRRFEVNDRNEYVSSFEEAFLQ